MPDSGVSADSDVHRVTVPEKLKNWVGDWADIFGGGHAGWAKADKVAKEVSLYLSVLFPSPFYLSLAPSLSRPSPTLPARAFTVSVTCDVDLGHFHPCRFLP